MIIDDIKIMQGDTETSLLKYPLYITSMSGLGSSIQTNTSDLYNCDGSKLNSERMSSRTISLTLQNFDRLHTTHNDWVYKHFPLKRELSLVFIGSNDEGLPMSRRLDCRVSKIEPADFRKDDAYKIQLLALDPYFHNQFEYILQNAYVLGTFEFSFENISGEFFEVGQIRNSTLTTVTNEGDVDIGFQAIFQAKTNIKGFSLMHLESGKSLTLSSNFKLSSGDTLIIDTRRGHRGVTLIDSLGSTQNVLSYLGASSSWIQIPRGESTLDFNIASGNIELLDAQFLFDISYGGI